MRAVTNSKNANPLMLNFMNAKTPETISASAMPVYEPQSQITMIMGGGGGGGTHKATRCNDGYKRTDDRTPGGTYTHNDSERYTDD
jgi:hypothetical protein